MKIQSLIAVILVLLVLAGVVIVRGSMFIIDEREQAIITRLNRPVQVILGDMPDEKFAAFQKEILETAKTSADTKEISVVKGAGLYFKVPFVDSVNRFPDTVLFYDAEPEDIILADKKKLIVDNFARWRIENPLLYWVRLREEVAARGALDDIIYSVVREELGKNNLVEVIRTSNRAIDDVETNPEDASAALLASEKKNARAPERVTQGREAIMKTVTAKSNELARGQYGISVIDVRIKRAELLSDNLQMVFGRMMAERSRISKGYRSDGQKQSDIIQSETDKQVQVILANARSEASKLKGEGDAEVLRLYAEAFNARPELYRYFRSLEVLEKSTAPGTELILGLDSSLYKILKPEE